MKVFLLNCCDYSFYKSEGIYIRTIHCCYLKKYWLNYCIFFEQMSPCLLDLYQGSTWLFVLCSLDSHFGGVMLFSTIIQSHKHSVVYMNIKRKIILEKLEKLLYKVVSYVLTGLFGVLLRNKPKCGLSVLALVSMFPGEVKGLSLG